MIPDLIGARSFSALAIGARQFVVQEAAEITVSSGFNSLWFTLYTMVGRSFPAGMIAGALTIAIKPVISLLGQNGGLSTATFNDFIAFFEYLIAVCLIVNMVDAFVKAYYAKIYNIN